MSALVLAQDDRSVLSGSWDKNVIDWDLNTGQPKSIFQATAGQISTIEMRPLSTLPVPEDSGEPILTNGTFSSNDQPNGSLNANLPNGLGEGVENNFSNNTQTGAGSPHDSLFGGDSLFGDDNGPGAGPDVPSGEAFGVDEDDELSRAIANDLQQQGAADAQGNITMGDADTINPTEPPMQGETGSNAPETRHEGSQVTDMPNGISHESSEPMVNGLPHAEESSSAVGKSEPFDEDASATQLPASETTFLAASIEGTIRVWDKRQPNPIARINPHGVPPWCVSACWSPDGNHIYAGRRNAVVEEFSLHKGFRAAERTFRFPSESSSVTALKAMPNGRHLLW